MRLRQFGEIRGAVADGVPKDQTREFEIVGGAAEQGRPQPHADGGYPRRAGPAPELVIGLGDVAPPASAGRIDALARRVAASVVVESQSGHPPRRETFGETPQYEVRAQVLLADR